MYPARFAALLAGPVAAVLLAAAPARADLVFDTTTAGAFVDISATGTNLNLLDDTSTDFTSTFLGTNVRVGNNGGLAVVSTGSGTNLFVTNTPLPNADALGGSEVFLALWDDWSDQIGGVFAQDLGDRLVVQWENRRRFGGSATDGVTFQVQVFGREATTAPGGVVAQYLYEDVTVGDAGTDNGAGATIGYQTDPMNAEQFSFNMASVFAGDVLTLRTSAVPEPASGVLVLLAAAGGLFVRRRRIG